MSNQDYHFGFHLYCSREPGNDGMFVHRIACFSAYTDIRAVYDLKSTERIDKALGAIVHFSTIEVELSDGVVIKFHEGSLRSIRHEDSVTDRIVYSMTNVAVGVKDFGTIGCYRHEGLGLMNDTKREMAPGIYHSIVFVVNVFDDTFEIEIAQAIRQEGGMSARAESTLEKFRRLPDVLAIEQAFSTNMETFCWTVIGKLKLVKYNTKYVLDGPRPVFSLMDMTYQKLFMEQADATPVTLVKMRLDANDEYVDDPALERYDGVVFVAGTKGKRCMVRLRSRESRMFARQFEIDAIFRFERTTKTDVLEYWRKEKYLQNEIFQSTVEENGNQNQDESLLNVLDGFRTDVESLKQIEDRNTAACRFDQSQLRAASMALNEQRKLVCIQGPPGTGKTRTLALIIYQLLKSGKTAVVLTPTNEAMNNIKAATENYLALMRYEIGENDFMDINKFSYVMNHSEEAKEVAECLKGKEDQLEAGAITEQDYEKERNSLLHILKIRTTNMLMKQVKVVFSTVTSSFVHIVGKCKEFNPSVCIIDEAAQVMEAHTWPSVFRMPRIVMAGDPYQLPALVFTKDGIQFHLATSIMERICERKEEYSWVMLQNQYRSHSWITEWSNKSFYNNELKQRISDGSRLIESEIRLRSFEEKLYNPFVMIDTCLETDSAKIPDTWESAVFNRSDERSITYANRREAELVVQHYYNLLSLGTSHENVAIISPYRGQTDLIGTLLNEKIPELAGMFAVGTVDSYQGQEYDIVIFSLVRNNPKKHLGFVSNLRRLNVAITRAKKQFMLIGNGWMLINQNQPEIRDLFEMFRSRKNRFPPDYVYGRCVPFKNEPEFIKNNFGKDFREFIAVCKDPGMKKAMLRYLELESEPYIRIQRLQTASERRAMEAKKKHNKYDANYNWSKPTRTETYLSPEEVSPSFEVRTNLWPEPRLAPRLDHKHAHLWLNRRDWLENMEETTLDLENENDLSSEALDEEESALENAGELRDDEFDRNPEDAPETEANQAVGKAEESDRKEEACPREVEDGENANEGGSEEQSTSGSIPSEESSSASHGPDPVSGTQPAPSPSSSSSAHNECLRNVIELTVQTPPPQRAASTPSPRTYAQAPSTPTRSATSTTWTRSDSRPTTPMSDRSLQRAFGPLEVRVATVSNATPTVSTVTTAHTPATTNSTLSPVAAGVVTSSNGDPTQQGTSVLNGRRREPVMHVLAYEGPAEEGPSGSGSSSFDYEENS
ncbi:unnamed protein product [Caenorhabditis sp. 36 PRJEB53466]|nr:unnamed protein product [Caenorhabditis sp. 36 PRJEB53466]